MFEKTTGRRRPVILVIDDSPSTTQLLSLAVADIGEVWTAGNGMQGLELARDKRPDLVLLDIEMAGMDGYAVCEAMKADPITADCAIIFVTGHDATVHEVQSLVSGGLDFLTKPLNVPVVRARVQIQLKLKYQADALARAQRDLASVVRNLPAFVSYWGMDLRNRFCNDPDGHWFGLTARAMREQHLESVLGAAAFATVQTPVEEVLKGKQSSFELVLEPPGQPLRYVQASLITGRTEGTIDGFLMLLTDITDHKVAKQALHNEKERFRTILSSIGDAVVVTDNQGSIMFVNPIAEEMTGWQSCEAMQRPIEDVMPLHDANSGEPVRNPARIALQENRIIGVTTNYMLQCRNQREWPVETSASPIHDHEGNPAGAVMVFHDVSAARALAIKMTHLAQHDVLTGLPNRILLEDRTVQAMAM
ncbi:PAS domain-containing protein [Parachitinimonas caeni]|uniref:PAS domain-containing protein n=1 Tax=Parachitinimonas caeni TaxID=3031301 RepID=A0ABT7E0J9_9NEIS|nr:PAS domain-containing protein [Parachitinimonas caeni]MDK2125837.1 PAS domain-containing protein [Parachitinimonas caeni]